jgi:DNA-binding GntR family transcriptional regulator
LTRKPTAPRRPHSRTPEREEGGILNNGQALLVYFGLAGEDDANGRRSGGTADAAIIIRNRILDLTLPPGSRIDDRLLMDRFNMGRTPAREAFNRIASEGLIIIERNRGAFVRPLDIQHIQHFFDAYIASERIVGYFCRLDDPTLERDIAQIQRSYLAAYAKEQLLQMTRANARLHGRIAVATRNEYVAENALRLYNHARRLSYFSYMLEQDFIPDLHETQAMIKADHEDIIDTVRNRIEGRLVGILSRHAVMFHSRITRMLSKTRGENSPLPLSPRVGDEVPAATRPSKRKARS